MISLDSSVAIIHTVSEIIHLYLSFFSFQIGCQFYLSFSWTNFFPLLTFLFLILFIDTHHYFLLLFCAYFVVLFLFLKMWVWITDFFSFLVKLYDTNFPEYLDSRDKAQISLCLIFISIQFNGLWISFWFFKVTDYLKMYCLVFNCIEIALLFFWLLMHYELKYQKNLIVVLWPKKKKKEYTVWFHVSVMLLWLVIFFALKFTLSDINTIFLVFLD